MTAPCPAPAQLLSYALADSNGPRDTGVMRHVTGCDTCQAAIRQLREIVNAVRLSAQASDAATPDCLDEEWITAFAEGSAEPAESSAQLAHLLACPRCCRQVASVARLLADASVKNQIEHLSLSGRTVRTRRLRVIGAMTGLAAAAALLLTVARHYSSNEPTTPAYREQSVTGAVPPVPIAPVGTATAIDPFRWRSVPRANRYRITVFDRDGSVVWEAQTRDTSIAIPASLARPTAATYLWRVEARVGWEERWAASDLTEFTLRPAPSR